jgi:hypothetical protein
VRRHISQREAHRLSKRCREFEQKYEALMRSFTSSYPGTHLRTIVSPGTTTTGVLKTAVRLGFPVAAKVEGNEIEFYAVKP